MRPMAGEQHLPEALARALRAGRLGHALLFSGAAGLGKGEAAVALARTLLCQETGAPGGCGACPDCRQVDAGAHPDLRWIAPAGGSIKLDQVRAVVRDAHLRPFRERSRVFIFRDAERMTDEAANALLKVLEEPPPAVHFVLLTAAPAALLPTIRSRCQEFPFRPLPPETVAAALAAEIGLGPEVALRIARLAGGNAGLARRLALGPELGRAEELARRMVAVTATPALDPVALFALAQDLDAFEAACQSGEVPLSAVDVVAWALRDALVAALGEGDGRAPRLLEALRAVQRARWDLAGGCNRRLVFEVLLMNLWRIVGKSYNFGDLSRFLELTSA